MESFTKMLNMDQNMMYIKFLTQVINSNEGGELNRLMSCPFCTYFELWASENRENVFRCKNQTCHKQSCIICFKIVRDEADLNDSIAGEESKEDGDHSNCVKFKDLKKEWDQAIEKGSKMFCPTCGFGGMKDDQCTHMTCENKDCKARWCYFCGDVEANLAGGTFYLHN
jgi:hypothetical protein